MASSPEGSSSPPVDSGAATSAPITAGASQEESAGFVKLAMRNMVRKGRQSLFHFGLTAVGLSAFLLLLAWLGRPRVPL